jgi:hypothetical protein
MTDKHKDNSGKPLEEDTDKPVYVVNKKQPFIITVILVLVFLVVFFTTNVFNPKPGMQVTGKIISPLNRTTIDKEIIVVGETKNVNAGQYIWLAFDNSEFRTCWPRIQVPGNIEFSITILEKSLKDDLRLSLYVMNEKRHKKWVEWQGTQNPRGVKLISGRNHLHYVNIILK